MSDSDGSRTLTTGYWTFTGRDRSLGFRNGRRYKLDVMINHDPGDFFIHANAKGWAGLRTDDVFYDSHEAFNLNWLALDPA